MSATKTEAGSRKGPASARSEKDSKPKSYTWRGIKFELPSKPPGTLLWDIYEQDPVSVLASLIGEEGSQKVKAKIAEDEVTLDELDDVLTELLGDVLSKYGLGLGESEASQSS